MNEISAGWLEFASQPGEATFAPFYDCSKALVWSICFRFLRNHDDAMDAFQATYCRLIHQAKTCDSTGISNEADSLVCRMTVREVQNLHKRRGRRLRREIVMDNLPEVLDERQSPVQAAAANEARRQLETLIALLPLKYQLPLVLHYFHDKTHHEIAGILETSRVNVTHHIKKGVKLLNPMARRAGLGDALSILAVGAAGGLLLQPPQAVAASIIFSQAQSMIAAGITGAAAGATAGTVAGASISSALSSIPGWIAMNIKAVTVALILVVGAGVVVSSRLDGSEKPVQPVASTPPAVVQGSVPMRVVSPAPAVASRVLHFPADRSMGKLLMRDKTIAWTIGDYWGAVGRLRIRNSTVVRKSGDYWGVPEQNWVYFAEARGDVAIPEGKWIMLIVSRAGMRDTSPLDRLPPDALNEIMCGDYPTDQLLASISTLSGLQAVDLDFIGQPFPTSCPVSPHALELLARLPALERMLTPLILTREHIKAIGRIASLKFLNLRSTAISGNDLAGLAPLKQLQELQINQNPPRELDCTALAQLPKLEYLVGNCFGDANMARLRNVPSLRFLNMGPNVTERGLAYVSSMTNLTGLVPSGITDDRSLAYLSKLTNLEDLTLMGTPINGSGLVHLAGLRSLKHLNLSRSQVTDDALIHLKPLTNLESLGLDCQTVTDSGLVHLEGLTKLKKLYLSGFSNSTLSDTGIKSVAKLKNLEELRVVGTRITDQGMADIGGLSDLKSISLSTAVSQVTNRGLAELARLGKLEVLRLHRMSISISGINSLGKLKNLRDLDADLVSDWSFVDDPPLDISGMESLETLWLPSVRDEDITCLSRLRNLRHLSLIGHRGNQMIDKKWDHLAGTISDCGLRDLAGLKNLRRLDIGGPGVTDAGLDYLKGMNGLEMVHLQGSITDQGLSKLEGLKGLYSINIGTRLDTSSQAQSRLQKALPSLHTLEVHPWNKWKRASAFPAAGTMAPRFSINLVDGKPFNLAEQKGKVVILYFWATWCAPCKASTPGLKEFYLDAKQRFGDRFEMIGLSLDDNDQMLRAYLETSKIPWLGARIGSGSQVAADYAVKAVPQYFLIGPDGKILLQPDSDQKDTITEIADALKAAGIAI